MHKKIIQKLNFMPNAKERALLLSILPKKQEHFGQTERIIAHVLLRKTVYSLLGKENREIKIAVDSYGKPYFLDIPLQFNLSHTKGAVAIALSDDAVGIDIERIRPVSMKIAQRFFTPPEIAYIGTSQKRFFEIWTKKEAYVKYIGKGLSFGLRSFNVLDLKDVSLYTRQVDDNMLSFACNREDAQMTVEEDITHLLLWAKEIYDKEK